MYALGVLQSYFLCNVLCHTHFLADGVYQRELAFWEKYCKRYSGETAACAHIQYLCFGSECQHFGYCKRVEQVVLLKVLYVFARDDVYLRVPLRIKHLKRSKLLHLGGAQIRKILPYQLHKRICLVGEVGEYVLNVLVLFNLVNQFLH